MASESPRKRLRFEVTCPICLEYFVHPVCLACEHNFCHTCILESWAISPSGNLCPLCKRTFHHEDAKPNCSVGEFAQLIKLLNKKEEEARREICEKHQEPLKLFCKDSKVLICTLCEKDHQNHNIVPVEEAIKECKDRISALLVALKRRKNRMVDALLDKQAKLDLLLKKMATHREKVAARFQVLWPFLKKHESRTLAWVKRLKKQMERKRDENMDLLSQRLSAVEDLIQEVEKKRSLPASQLLKDVGSVLKRSEQKVKLMNPLWFEDLSCFYPELHLKVWALAVHNVKLERAMKNFEDTVASIY